MLSIIINPVDKMSRPVKSFKNVCPSAEKGSSRFPVTKVCSYKILKLAYFTICPFFVTTFFFSSSETMSWHILVYHTSNKCGNMNSILNNRLFEEEDSKTKIADFPRHQWQISKVMVGRKEEETEVFLETLTRLLIDPAIGRFKLGCFNQPRNSSRRAFSFIFFPQKENFFAWYNYNKVYFKFWPFLLKHLHSVWAHYSILPAWNMRRSKI